MSARAWKHDRTAQERGYGTAWRKARDAAMQRDCGLCQPCAAKGRVTLASEVDHRIPKARGGTDDADNLQAICKACHAAKTAADNGRRVRPTIGLDGWPVGD